VVAEIIPYSVFICSQQWAGACCRFSFWRRFAESKRGLRSKSRRSTANQTLQVVRAVAETGRDEIALLYRQRRHIVLDLLTPFRF